MILPNKSTLYYIDYPIAEVTVFNLDSSLGFDARFELTESTDFTDSSEFGGVITIRVDRLLDTLMIPTINCSLVLIIRQGNMIMPVSVQLLPVCQSVEELLKVGSKVELNFKLIENFNYRTFGERRQSVLTNYEKIKSMSSAAEMAECLRQNLWCYSCDNYQLNTHQNEDCLKCAKRINNFEAWLNQKVGSSNEIFLY